MYKTEYLDEVEARDDDLEICDDDIKLDHIPDVKECRELRKQMKAKKFWPNVFHINDHGNVDLLAIGYNGAKILQSWV
jgi:hypothetical protein